MSDWQFGLLLFTVAAVSGLAMLAARRMIEGRIKLEFDGKLEVLKAEQRVREEAFKSELRAAESQIIALRDGALSRRAARDVFLDKRRIEAAEQLWTELTRLSSYKMLVAMTANMKAVIERHEALQPGFKAMFGGMLKPFPPHGPVTDAKRHQPFVSTPAWAYFSAYQAIVGVCFAQAKMFELGVHVKDSVMDQSSVHDLILAALPGAKPTLQQWGARSYFQLLDLIEAKLLDEINRSLEGATVDAEQINRYQAIINLANSVSAASTKAEVDALASSRVGPS